MHHPPLAILSEPSLDRNQLNPPSTPALAGTWPQGPRDSVSQSLGLSLLSEPWCRLPLGRGPQLWPSSPSPLFLPLSTHPLRDSWDLSSQVHPQFKRCNVASGMGSLPVVNSPLGTGTGPPLSLWWGSAPDRGYPVRPPHPTPSLLPPPPLRHHHLLVLPCTA